MKWPEDPEIDYIMPWGKHKGMLVSDLPEDYVMWLADQEWAYNHSAVCDAIVRRAIKIAKKWVDDYEPHKGLWTTYDPSMNGFDLYEPF